MNWKKADISPQQVKDIGTQYGCDLLTASVLVRRGICSGDAIKFFLEDDLWYLHNPFLLPGMEDAVDRILAAKDEGEKVLIFGDGDVDGITGTVLLAEYLSGLGMDVTWRIPGGDDPYGLSLSAVEEFAEAYGTLIITVDCGISRIAEIKRAGELSVDVIVTDHHEPQEQLPSALVIIDPKLKDSSNLGSPYPFKDLSGCGVAFKLVSALRFALKSELYGQHICLLNTRPANDAWIVEAAKVRNLVVSGIVTETIVSGMVSISDTRLPAFLEGQQILAWDAPLQKRTLAKLFGNGVEVEMLDIAPEIGKEIPAVAGKSLIRIKELSTIAKYADRELTELDVFANLFCSFVQRREKISPENFDLQLVTLGTIGDIMPLLNENRIFIRAGIKSLSPASGASSAPRPGIAELLDKLELSGTHFDVKDIAWKLCPAINAARRMGCPEKAAALFFEKDRSTRERLAEELVDMNKQRKLLEEEIWAIAEPMAYKSLSVHSEKLALVYGEEISRGVTGLIAQRVSRRFNVPSLAVSFAAEVYTGSVRSARGYNIGGLLEQFGDLFIDSGGHEFAGGFSLKKEHWNDFTERLKTVAYAVEFDETKEGEDVSIDAEIPLDYLNPDLLKLTDLFAPYGKDNAPLNFLAKNLVIEELYFIGKVESKHLRMTLAGGKHKWPALYWDAAARVLNKEFGKGDRVDAVFNISRDWYRGVANPQMMIIDLRRSE
jgi:single-stranded-DNA-specific exonuclease